MGYRTQWLAYVLYLFAIALEFSLLALHMGCLELNLADIDVGMWIV